MDLSYKLEPINDVATCGRLSLLPVIPVRPPRRTTIILAPHQFHVRSSCFEDHGHSLSTMPPHDLKSAQLAAVQRMLSFNEDESTQWKVLIYDASCRSIISPILSVQQLRKQGVTLHLLLHSEREPIPDVPAVYFCRPTKENLARIAQDCAKGLYSRVHLNFVTKLERTLMEDFARLVVQSGSLGKVASVHDQYLDYVCMEQGLFSLAKKDSYVLYNNPNATEASIEAAMTDIAYGLFSVVATLGQIPVIRCPSVRRLSLFDTKRKNSVSRLAGRST